MTTKNKVYLSQADQGICDWVSENIKILPTAEPEAVDTWEEYVTEAIRLAMPSEIAEVQHAEAFAAREEDGEPEVVLIKILHGVKTFHVAFHIGEDKGRALLTPTSMVE